MASDRQLAANRRNGRRGGPTTCEGKQRSRINSLQHGLTATTLVVLPEEHQHEYEELLRGFRDSFDPHDPAEEALVLRLAQAHWRGLRARRVETAILHITAADRRAEARNVVNDCPEHLNAHNAIAVGFMTMPADHWQMYLRYDTTISRDFFKTLDALTKLQRARRLSARGGSLSTVAERPRAMAAGAGAHLSDFGIGSVSQNAEVSSNLTEQQPLTEQVSQAHERTEQPLERRQALASDVPAAEGEGASLNIGATDCLTIGCSVSDAHVPPAGRSLPVAASAGSFCCSPLPGGRYGAGFGVSVVPCQTAGGG